jgi:NADPH-dependent 2,4-dienoyl-CoA reductase/sulfur reductase-like enzyme
LGGQGRLAAETYSPNAAFLRWLEEELDRPGIAVRLNTRATLESIMDLSPDAVIVATGSTPGMRDIVGSDLPHVYDAAALLHLGPAPDAATPPHCDGQAIGLASAQNGRSKLLFGHHVAIIGGDLIGLRLAEYLHKRNWRVTVIDAAEQLGRGLSPALRSVMLDAMPLEGIALNAGASSISIQENSVRFEVSEGQTIEIHADTVIIANGSRAETSLFDQIHAKGLEAYMIGDCGGTGYILGAMREAADVAAKK